jgi:Asp-tRNA(Asn)/Glu-tRNA(Gln) amidotransferase A subunit family amidase
VQQGPERLPVGVQVIGRIGDDARALAAGEWLQDKLGTRL